MAPATPSPPSDPAKSRVQPRLRFPWRRRGSVTTRILLVNLIVLVLLAGSLFYLDSYRNQLIEERFKLARSEAEIIADALAVTPASERRAMLARIGQQQKLRLRLYNLRGELTLDSFAIAEPTFTFSNPAGQPWYQDAARGLDRGMDFVLGKDAVEPYAEPQVDRAVSWSELNEARSTGKTAIAHRAAPDRTPVLSAAVNVGIRGELLLSTRNATDITQSVRDARQRLANVIGVALLLSIYLSLFLGRTIVQPLRELVRAAVRVRLGRDRAVEVPRLPDRRDEIGLLARAISDMSLALRQRIDAVEAFAADVAHEIKNPLASLRSALEALDKVDDPKLRKQLAGIAQHDVLRIDRLVTEIADASRIDAELSRTQFVSVDIGALLKQLLAARAQRKVDGDCQITLNFPRGAWLVNGDAPRLERVFENLLDNAVSFSPPGGVIEVAAAGADDHVQIAVADCGPGIPAEVRERVFERFHSLRPETEDFGGHSGLGLAIARTIIAAHDGTLSAIDRPDGQPGACLLIELPLAAESDE